MAEPANLAEQWTRGVQTGAQIKEAQNRLQQQQQEQNAKLQMESMQMQERAKQVEEEHRVQQQRIAVAQSYNNQKAALRKQQLDQVAKVNAEKTMTAARQFEARQQWDKGFAEIDANEDLSPEEKDAEKTRFTMRLAPMMGIPGTEAAAMLREMRPPKPTVPASVTDRGDFLMVTQPNGQVQLHPKPKAAAERDPLVKVQLQEEAPPTSMSRSQAMQVIPSLPKELQTNAVNKAVTAAAAPAGMAKYRTAEEVRAAYKAGKISRAEAKKLLVDEFGHVE